MMNETNTAPVFSSRGNGKLLLSGEYLVLRGARSLSVPLKLGQSLDVYQSQETGFSWEARHTKGIWNTVHFDNDLHITQASDMAFAQQLQNIISEALKLRAVTVDYLRGKKAFTQMDFLPEWGLGSSSTLIYNLATFFNVNPYVLLKSTFRGSGYDIANAGSSKPIFFSLDEDKPQVEEVNFSPTFRDHIYFIYTNKKQSSKSSIKGFEQKNIGADIIQRVSAISDKMLACSHLSAFQELMCEHEAIIGDVLGQVPVQHKHFSDFNGCIKSLGAWGGDFVMAVTDKPKSYVVDYFENKGMKIIFGYGDLVLNDSL